MSSSARTGPAQLLTAVFIAAVALTMLVTAYDYSRASGLFPRFIGWIFLSLALLEVLLQFRSLIRERRGTTEPPAQSGDRDSRKRFRAVVGFVWLAFLLVALYLTGFIIATPLFVFAFLRVSAGKDSVRSGLIAAGITGFVYVVFVELLKYKLYTGVWFDA